MDDFENPAKEGKTPLFGYRLKEERTRHKTRESGRTTQEDLARAMGVSRGLISRIETGNLLPTLDFAIRADDALGTRRLFQSLLPTPENEVTRSLSRYVTTEQTEAVALSTWQATVVPALLQDPGYARAVRSAAVPPHSKAEIDSIVAAQEKRQNVLTREEPKPLNAHFVLAEGSVRQLVGGRNVMVGQWRRLAEWAALPSVTIQVLPASVGAHPAMQGSYTILDMPPRLAGQAALYVETMASGAVITDTEQVAHARQRFGGLMAHALSPPETMAYLQRLQEDEEEAWH